MAHQESIPGLSAKFVKNSIDARHVNCHNRIETNIANNHFYGAPEDLRLRIVQWLRPVNYKLIHDKIASRRAPGTGKWLLESPKYKKWIKKSGKAYQNLECRGKAGSGKSTLASAVVDDLLHRFPPQSSKCIVLYVYFRYDTQESQDVPNVVANLLSQVVEKAGASKALEDLYNTYVHQKDVVTTLEKTIAAILSAELAVYKRAYIVADAIDEYCVENYDSCRDLIKSLQRLPVKLLVTSRNKVPFSRGSFTQIEVWARPGDVGGFVDQSIGNSRLDELCDRSPGLRDLIHEKISEKAEGMFVIPSLQMEWISQMETPQDVRDALEELPTGLQATYRVAMDRILSQGRERAERAIKALSWVSYAKNPMTVPRLRAAVSFKAGKDCLEEDSLIGEEDILSSCAGLLVLSKINERVAFQFVHRSAQEFLAASVTEFIPNAERQITETCLRYLIQVTSTIPPEFVQEIIASARY